MLLLHQDEKETLYSIVFSFIAVAAHSQQQTTTINGYMVPVCVYKGDTIPAVQLPNVYIFRPLKFKTKRKTGILPLGKECEENPAISP